MHGDVGRSADVKTAIVLTAAGMSRRFRQGNGHHKLLAVLKGKPVLQHTLEQAKASGMDVIVVTRLEDKAIHALLHDVRPVFCVSGGLGESIAAGVGACLDYDAVIIALGDMPFLTAESYQAVNQALHFYPLARPQVEGQPGHPVGFQRSFFPALQQLTGDVGAQSVLKHQQIRYVPLSDRGCLDDIDYPDDLRHVRSHL
ncbi:nucleotidyltransferase family protein (plasmid) [Pantoea allii]|uniref:nucleotidyltransferase family protein n=1 Tax=Pantoea allii TaxID=574096 RepID=UPI001560D423|nr:nucleotidyltransferase family protein [Pantoea allii]NQS84421.1 nucleotidyltransferase family protein [Pantoea allii]